MPTPRGGLNGYQHVGYHHWVTILAYDTIAPSV